MKGFLIALMLLFSFCSLSGQGESLRLHVNRLADTTLMGRKAGSDGEKGAAEYLYRALKEAGVTMISPETGDDFAIVDDNDSITSRNVVGIVDGADDVLRSQYVVVGAHLDHLGVNALTVNGKKMLQIYPGADDASGLAALIEIAERVAATSFMFRRSVIFAAFGSMERGMAGSWYFVNRVFGDKDSISVMIDINSIGRSGPDNPFLYFTGIPNADLHRQIEGMENVASLYHPQLAGRTPFPSDYLAFYEQGIPAVLLTTGRGPLSRTVKDTPESLDYDYMEYICDYIYYLIRETANRDQMIERVEVTEIETPDGEETIYSPYNIDKAPTFLKGDERKFLEEWVYQYLKYPDYPLEQGIQGEVVVEFIVEKDGSVTNVRAVRGVDEHLENEAVRVVSASPKWKPGIMGGKKVRVKYSIPVEFRLRKKK